MGVDVSSGVEAQPGRKDPHKLGAFITAAARRPATSKAHRRDTPGLRLVANGDADDEPEGPTTGTTGECACVNGVPGHPP